MAFKKKAQGHDVVIATAGKLYDESVQMFTEAEKKIDEAQVKLGSTIQEIDATIAELQVKREQAVTDQLRNNNFKSKLKEFTTL